jgi:uncharacterized protein YhbP (UPF0306 family)
MNEELNRRGYTVITSNIYMTLATMGETPWAAPVYYCTDEKLNFYFISTELCLHSQQIEKNPVTAFAIYDSHQPNGEGIGVQGIGKTSKVTDKNKISEGLRYYRTDFIQLTPEKLMPPNPYRLYKLIPEHFYTLDPDSEIDERAEIYPTETVPVN